MPHEIRTFAVATEPATALAYLADLGNAEQWDPGIEKVTRTDEGPIGVGARWSTATRLLGVRFEIDYAITELDGEHVTFDGETEAARSTFTLTTAPHELGVEITYEATVELHGAAKLGTPVVQYEMDLIGDETVTGIRTALEGG